MPDEQTHEDVVNLFYEAEVTEPLEKPTEAEADETPAETKEESTEVADESEEEAEELEAGEDETNEAEDVQSIEIDGTEHNLTDIQEWKEAHDNVKLMQADCTKKWQEAADLKKDAETQSTKAQELVLELELMVLEDKELDLESYKDIESENYDPDEYIRLKDKADKREAKLKELKASQPDQQTPLTNDELVAESNDFYAHDPLWLDDEKQLTPKFQEDMKVAGNYLKEAGYSQDEVNAISYSHHWKTILDAAKYRSQLKKGSALKKKVIKAPKVTKPKANSSTAKSASDIMYGS